MKVLVATFANLEMRVLTHFSLDKNLMEMFANNYDTHGSTAKNMFNLDCTPDEVKKKYPHLRQAGKVLNFLLMYGGGAFNLYTQLKENHDGAVDLGSKEYLEMYNVKRGVDVAQIYIDKYFESYSGVARFIKHQQKFAHKYGYVYTLLKRKRRLPDINSNDPQKRAYSERLATNACVQGSAADLTMSAQNRVNKNKRLREIRCYAMIQIHDKPVKINLSWI